MAISDIYIEYLFFIYKVNCINDTFFQKKEKKKELQSSPASLLVLKAPQGACKGSLYNPSTWDDYRGR